MFFFFFLRVAVGSQRQGNCLSSEKGGGEYEFPMAEIKWKRKKKKKWQQPWTAISKNIYFSLQNPQERSGKAGRGGWGAETERVHCFTEGCWTGMCFPKTLRAQKHDLKTIAHLQFPGWGPDALHPVLQSNGPQRTLAAGGHVVTVLKDHQKNRITTDPVLSDTAAHISGVPGSVTAQITAHVYRTELWPRCKECAQREDEHKEGPAAAWNIIHITKRALCAANIQGRTGLCCSKDLLSSNPSDFFTLEPRCVGVKVVVVWEAAVSKSQSAELNEGAAHNNVIDLTICRGSGLKPRYRPAH